MGGLQNSELVLLLPTFLGGALLSLAVVPLRALLGLTCYFAATSKEGQAAAARSGGKKVRARGRAGGKKEGTGAGAAATEDYDLGGAESLIVTKTSLPLVVNLGHRGSFENLAIVSLQALVGLAVGQAAERLLGWAPSIVPPLFGFGVLFVALLMLAQVDLLSPATSPENKIIAAVWAVLGFAAALALHVLQPGSGRLLSWDLQRAAAAVGPAINQLVAATAGKALQARGLKADALRGPELSMTGSAMHVFLALLASAFAVLLFAPAQRFARSYFLQTRPPEWGADYIAPRPLATAGLTLHFLLPALTALLWVRPMFQELLQLSPGDLAVAQAAALLLTAAVMAANLRTLLQRFMDRALTGWHQLKHGHQAARGNKDEKRTLGELIRMHCQVTHHLLGKVAVQTLGPAVLHLGLGLLQLNAVLHPAETGSAAAETQALMQSCVGFLAFWTGACWFAYCAGMLWMFRTGMLQP